MCENSRHFERYGFSHTFVFTSSPSSSPVLCVIVCVKVVIILERLIHAFWLVLSICSIMYVAIKCHAMQYFTVLLSGTWFGNVVLEESRLQMRFSTNEIKFLQCTCVQSTCVHTHTHTHHCLRS